MYFKIGLLSTIHVNQSEDLFDKYFEYDHQEEENENHEEDFTRNKMKIKIMYYLDLIEKSVIFQSMDNKVDVSVFFKLLIHIIDRFYGTTQHFNSDSWSDVIIKVTERRPDFDLSKLLRLSEALLLIDLRNDNVVSTLTKALAKIKSKIIEQESSDSS